MGTMIRRSRSVAQKLWELSTYSTPVSVGISTGMVWNRRDVLCAPVLFTMMFIGVTWSSGKPESALEFARQLHGNAKVLRSGFPRTFRMIYHGWGVARVTFFFSLVVCVYWGISRRITSERRRRSMRNIELPPSTRPAEIQQG